MKVNCVSDESSDGRFDDAFVSAACLRLSVSVIHIERGMLSRNHMICVKDLHKPLVQERTFKV